MNRGKTQTCSSSSFIHKERDLNMELLRIITMMMIMILHADFFCTGGPNHEDVLKIPIESFLKSGIEALTIISVNVFVLLSGWYGIHPKKNKMVEFFFQVGFFHLLGLIIAVITHQDINFRSFISMTENLWFVKAYLLLYILSPVLNTFSDYAERHIFQFVLIGFFIMQTVYGWFYPDYNMPFSRGYSTISFMGLYLLARYVRLHQPFFALWTARKYLYVYLLLSIIITLLFYIRLLGVIPQLPLLGDMYAYTSPFVILSSLSFLLLFSKLSFRNKMAQSVARSCFAVYLFHANKYVIPYFVSNMLTIYRTESYALYLLYSTTFCIIIYFIAIILDQVRLSIYSLVTKLFDMHRVKMFS